MKLVDGRAATMRSVGVVAVTSQSDDVMTTGWGREPGLCRRAANAADRTTLRRSPRQPASGTPRVRTRRARPGAYE